MAEFFLELFSEEIPARMQADAAAHVRDFMTRKLTENELKFDKILSFAASRRIGVTVQGLPVAQADLVEERKGPAVSAPEQALNGFLRSTGLAKGDLIEKDTPKGRFYFANISRKGRPTAQVLQECVAEMLASFPWPKSMRWNEHKEHWVRPLHAIVCLFDGKVVPVEFAGVKSGNQTYGHRFLAPEAVTVEDYADYEKKMRKAYVLVNVQERKDIISQKAHELAKQAGCRLLEDEALLNEVAGLAEYPVPLKGSIDERFMAVPQEVLITSMRANQKYFCMTDENGKMAPSFVVVANMLAADGGKEIVAGNERVLRARLSDAEFFWDSDRKEKLETKVEALKNRVFHAKLGSVYDKIERIRKLLPEIVRYIPEADLNDADRAAVLCKADLSTGMVGEFPELQGIMGRYYALHDGENTAVADAIAQHYSPLGPNDSCPTAPVSIALALADKIDTLVGFWLIDVKPTGSKDPFALRRAALGVIRLILENKISMPIMQIFNKARMIYAEKIQGAIREAITMSEKKKNTQQPMILTNWSALQIELLMGFLAERLKVLMKDKGVRHDYISAVYGLVKTQDISATDLCRMIARVRALARFLDTEDGKNLLTAYRRAANIVRIEESKGDVLYRDEPKKMLFEQHEEGALFDTLAKVVLNSSGKIAVDDFEGAMEVLATLRKPVDAFFDNVTVNCDDGERRANRLRLLNAIVSAMGGVADFSVIEG